MTKIAYAIAGSEATGGAGVQTDLRTFVSLCVYGVATITCIVSFDVKNNWNHILYTVPENTIREQFESVNATHNVKTVKIGMLPSKNTVNVVADLLKTKRWDNVVVDPVLICKGQNKEDALGTKDPLITKILPIATIVTPNILEAEMLSNMSINTVDDMKTSAKKIQKLGPKCVIIKGGNRFMALDVMLYNDAFYKLETKYEKNVLVSGAGCTFSSAITANIVNGFDTIEAVKMAKNFTYNSILNRCETNAPFTSINQLGN